MKRGTYTYRSSSSDGTSQLRNSSFQTSDFLTAKGPKDWEPKRKGRVEIRNNKDILMIQILKSKFDKESNGDFN
jgi:hypothetical protein